jgi:hypothetical protein
MLKESWHSEEEIGIIKLRITWIEQDISNSRNVKALAKILDKKDVSDESKAAIKSRIEFVEAMEASDEKTRTEKIMKKMAEKSINKDNAEPTEADEVSPSSADGVDSGHTSPTSESETDDTPADVGILWTSKNIEFCRGLGRYRTEILRCMLEKDRYSKEERKIIKLRIMWAEQGISKNLNVKAITEMLHDKDVSNRGKATIESRIGFVKATKALSEKVCAAKRSAKIMEKSINKGGAGSTKTDGASPGVDSGHTSPTSESETDDTPADVGILWTLKNIEFCCSLSRCHAKTLKFMLKKGQHSEEEIKIIELRIMWIAQDISNNRSVKALAKMLSEKNIFGKEKAVIESRIGFVRAMSVFNRENYMTKLSAKKDGKIGK